jgi:hypothetical protein
MKKQLVTPTTPLGQAPPPLGGADAEEADKNRSITAKAKTIRSRTRVAFGATHTPGLIKAKMPRRIETRIKRW